MSVSSPVLTLTMNPAVDVSSTVATMEAFHKLRCTDVRHHAGGGGINVSRVIKRCDAETLAIFPSGGPMGALLNRLLTDEGVPYLSIPVAGDTREDFSVTERASGQQFRFILPGPVLSATEIEDCRNAVVQQLGKSSFLVASGSLSPGIPADFFAQLAKLAVDSSAKFVLDTSGAPLRAAIESGGIFLAKPSQSELSDLAGKPVGGRDTCIAIARDIVRSGRVEFVCVSLGGDGALLVGREQALFASAPQVELKTTIGAGDSLLAALVLAFARGASPAEALKIAVAAGTASLLTSGTGLCSAADIERMKARVEVETLQCAV